MWTYRAAYENCIRLLTQIILIYDDQTDYVFTAQNPVSLNFFSPFSKIVAGNPLTKHE